MQARFFQIAAFAASFLSLQIAGSPVNAQDACTAETLTSCPGLCVERCEVDSAFFDSHSAACGRIFRDQRSNPDALDPANCAPAAAPFDTALGTCLGAARSIERRTTGNPDVDDFFDGWPSCAQTVFALEDQYACLKEETDHISSQYVPLVDRGYGSEANPLNRDLLCEIPQDVIDRDDLVAETLKDRSGLLTAEFSTVSSCRRELETWLNDKTSDCANSATGNCEQTIQQLIDITKEQIEPAKALELDTQKIVDGVEKQIELILGAIRARVVICE